MIPEPLGWLCKRRGESQIWWLPESKAESKADAEAAAAGKPAGGNIRYRERVYPLRRFKEVVDQVLLYRGALNEPVTLHCEQFNTEEGELAGWAEVHVHRDTQPALLLVGAIFGEAHAAVLDAWTTERERFLQYKSLARELVYRSSLGLGIRRRRFFYEPPPLWHGLARSLTACWYPPGHPQDATCITVYPANPYSGSLEKVFELWLADEVAKGFRPHGETANRRLLVPAFDEGMSWSLRGTAADGDPLFRQLVLFRGAPYCYTFLLDTCEQRSPATHREVFQRLTASAQVLPPPRSAAPSFVSTKKLLNNWAD